MTDDLLRLLTLQDPNTRIVLIGTGLLGLCSGVIGSLAVLRRRALMGDALAHAALPGLWVAFFLTRDRSFLALLAGAAVAGALGVATVAFIRDHTRVKEDAAIGIVLSGFFAAGLCLSRIIGDMHLGNSAGLDGFLFGKAAAMLPEDVWTIAAVAAATVAIVTLLFKEFRLLCFDREFGATQGWPVRRLDLALMLLLVVCTVVGLPAVGVVLMAALLIIPAAAARFWTHRLHRMIVLAAFFGAVSGVVGSAVSALHAKISTGPAVVLTSAVIFTGSMLFAPQRGVVASLLRRRGVIPPAAAVVTGDRVA